MSASFGSSKAFRGVDRADVAVRDGVQRQGQVDIVDAAPQVIAALPGMTPEIVHAIVAARDAGLLDRKSLPELLGGVGQGAAAADAGKAFRVGVRVAFDNGRRSVAEAVILLPDDGPSVSCTILAQRL